MTIKQPPAITLMCAGLPWWSFGSRRARIACGGSPHTLCTKPANIMEARDVKACKYHECKRRQSLQIIIMKARGVKACKYQAG
jgi:hypothetical protein